MSSPLPPQPPASESREAVRLARGTVAFFLLTSLGLGINYVYGIVISRRLGAEAFGLFSVGTTVCSIVSLMAVSGLDHAMLRFIPGLDAGGQWAAARATASRIVRVGCGIGIAAGAVLFLAAPPLSGRFFGKAFLRPVIDVIAVAVPAAVTGTLLLAFLQARHDVRKRLAIKYLAEPVSRFGLSLGLIAGGWGLSGALAGYAASFWVSGYLALRTFPRREAAAGGEIAAGAPVAGILRFAGPLAAGTAITLLTSRSDILILGRLPDAAQAGLFAAASQTAGIMAIVLYSVESVVAPHLSGALTTGDRPRVRSLYALALRWTLMLGVPLLALGLLFPREIMGLFGARFRGAAGCLAILAGGQFINLATGSANYILLLAGKPVLSTLFELAAGVVQLSLNLLLIPHWGIQGAAAAMLVSVLVANILRLVAVKRLLGLHPYERGLWKPLLAGLLLLAAILPTGKIFGGAPPLWLAPILFAAYAGILLAMGLHPNDRKAVEGLFGRACLSVRARVQG